MNMAGNWLLNFNRASHLFKPSRRKSVAREILRVACVAEPLESRMLLAFGPAGPEFPVNTYTTGTQSTPSVAMDAAGDFIVAWMGFGQDGSSFGVYAQRYNAAGVPQGAEFPVNTYTTGNQNYPSVAMDAAGDFIVAWMSKGQDGSGYGVYAQRYNAAGEPQGAEFRVNTYTTGDQFDPSVAMDTDGDFIVAWTSRDQDGSNLGIYAQRYNAASGLLGGEFRVNTYTIGYQVSPSVAMDTDGDFIVAWTSAEQDGDGDGVYAQLYNAAGGLLGGEFRVNTYTAGHQWLPSVAMDAAGDSIVTWMSYGQDGSGYGLYAQRYNAAGGLQGGEFRVNTYTTSDQWLPSVAMDSAGNFIMAWTSLDQDGSGFGVYAQRYNAAGLSQGVEFPVNTYTTNAQRSSSVAVDAAGDFIVVWTSSAQDGSGFGVYAQRYSTTIIFSEFTGTFGDDTLLLRRNGDNFEMFRQNPPIGLPDVSEPLDEMTSLTLHLLGGDDTVIIDFTGGDPIPPGGLYLDAGSGLNTLNFIGPVSGNINITGGTMDIAADPNGGSLILSETAAVRFTSSAHLASLSLADNAKATLVADGGHFIRTGSLSLAGAAGLDLNDNDLILQSSAANRSADLAAVAGLINGGRNGGVWNGLGIISSTAAAEPNKLTGLAVALNDKGGSILYSTFDGEGVDANSILVKYTYNGDADLSGKIDADDYFQIDNGFALKSAGYRNGDFDFNGVVDADDYFLIDRAFVGQSGVLATKTLTPALSHGRGSKHRSGRHHRKGQ
jgi:hypothetical protein